MNILHVEGFFHPDAGYQLNVLAKYMVKKGHQVTIITCEPDKFPDYLTSFFGKEDIRERDLVYEKNNGVRIIRVPVVWYYSGRAWATRDLFAKIREVAPDIVFAHCNDDMVGIRTINYCIKHRIPVVTDNHMAEIASKNKLRELFRFYYRSVETPKLIKHHIPVIRTADIDFVQKHYKLPLSQCPVISFGSDLMLFSPNAELRGEIRQSLDIDPDETVVIYAGKLDESKGGLFLANSLQEKFDVDKKLCFIVIGNTVGEYGQEVLRSFKESENRVILLPTQKYADLSKYFVCSDFALIPRQSSLTFYDYQACGLPVIAEDNNINQTRVDHDNGWLFEAGNVEAFRKSIVNAINLDPGEYRRISENSRNYIVENYNYDTKCDEYLEVLLQAYDRQGPGRING